MSPCTWAVGQYFRMLIMNLIKNATQSKEYKTAHNSDGYTARSENRLIALMACIKSVKWSRYTARSDSDLTFAFIVVMGDT